MAYFASSFTALTKQKGAFSGILAWINEDWSKAKRIFFPPNCAALEGRPAHDILVNRTYIVGGFSRNLVIDEMFRASVQGITVPPAPSVSAGAGTDGQIGYLRFYDEITGERSSLSAGTVFTGNSTRTWATLPTSVPGEIKAPEGLVTFASGQVFGLAGVSNFHDLRPGDRIAVSTDLTRWAAVRSIQSSYLMTIDDTTMAGTGVTIVISPVSRVSHVELWVSFGGALPRFVMRVRIGTTSVTESVAALAMGEAFTDNYEPMPKGSFNVIYNSRQIVAGVAGQRDRVFVSVIGYPERYGGLNFQTKYGEPFVGLVRTRDYVACLCPKSSYRLQGFTEDDFVLTGLEPEIGGIGHGGNAVCGGRVFVPSREQIQIFDGAFSDGMPTRSSEWSRNLRLYADAFQSGRGIVDPVGQTYRFLPFPIRRPDSGGSVVQNQGGCAAVGYGDMSEIKGERIYLVTGEPGTIGLFWFTTQQDPPLHREVYSPTDDVDTALVADGDGGGWIGGHTSTTVYLKRVVRGKAPELVASYTHGGVPDGSHIYSVEKYQGTLYLACDGDTLGGNGYTLRYDGTSTLVVDDPAPTGDYHAVLVRLGADLYRLGGIVPAGLVVRRKTAGAWAALTIPVGLQGIVFHDAVVYKNAIYFCVRDGQIGKVVGSTVTSEHTCPGGVSFYPVKALCVFKDVLYWVGSYDTGDLYIGSFDGTTWTDELKNLTTQFSYLVEGSGDEDSPWCYFFGEFEGTLRLAMQRDLDGYPCPVNWFSAPDPDPLTGLVDLTGDWKSHGMWHQYGWRTTYGDRVVRQWGIF